MASIPSPYKKRWQAYLVRNKTDMASMSSPLCHQHGKHTWSPLLLTWQAYLVRNKTDIESMLSSLYHHDGEQNRSLLWQKWQTYLVSPYRNFRILNFSTPFFQINFSITISKYLKVLFRGKSSDTHRESYRRIAMTSI